jgi:hypothetical protein
MRPRRARAARGSVWRTGVPVLQAVRLRMRTRMLCMQRAGRHS